MSRAARTSAIVLFFALVLYGMVNGEDERELTATSFGKVPSGFGAAYDLLRELGMPTVRSFEAPSALRDGDTVWWIHPASGCADESLADPAFGEWLARGGTAVVFLPPALAACREDARIAGLAIPPRTGSEACLPASLAIRAIHLQGEKGEPESSAEKESREEDARSLVLSGPLLRGTRRLAPPRTALFEPEDAWTDAAREEGADGGWEVGAASAEGRPFALSHRVGQGRLVVVAHGCFLQNGVLGQADAALVAVDLAQAFGAPRIDERAHGLVPSRSSIAYLAHSPAAIVFAGLGLLALSFAWFGAAEPPRRVAELDLGAPTLEAYVKSLAGLYAATRDHARVLDRYRELTARRLRRHFGLPPDAPLPLLAQRLERRGRISRAALAELRSEAPARSAADLARGVAMLDRLVEEATR